MKVAMRSFVFGFYVLAVFESLLILLYESIQSPQKGGSM